MVKLNTQNPHSLDVPGWHLRRGLLALHPQNEKTLILLMGEQGYNPRKLGDLMPKKE